MMTAKWYEETDGMHDVFVMKRLRLARNVAGHVFPDRMEPEERERFLGELERLLLPVRAEDGTEYDYRRLSDIPENERSALFERRIINQTRVTDQAASGLAVAPDESISILLNGEDHVRMQYLSSVQSLKDMWYRMDALDDRVGELIPYAFDEKYGYLTSYLTNVGTGLRASIVVHLPMLASGKLFRRMLYEYSRLGISVTGLAGDSGENYGGLYEVKNQKTLGQTEEELIRQVEKIAAQLAGEERKVASAAIESHRLQLEDEVYKSYGVLKYAKKLTYKEAMSYLSQLRMGLCRGLIELKDPVNLFGIMLCVRPSNLREQRIEKMDDEMLDVQRAEYIRSRLPEMK